MSSLIQQLGDNWHQSHPYYNLIQSVLPDTPYLEKLEDQLLYLYEDEHYDFKSLKNNSLSSIYDGEINQCESEKKKKEHDMKQEEEVFKKMCEKFENLSHKAKYGEDEKEEEEEEQEDDYVEDTPGASVQKDNKIQMKQTSKDVKETPQQIRERERREAELAKSLKSSMATLQAKLMDYQKDIDELELRIQYYGHYRDADKDFIGRKRKLIQAYAKDKNVEAIIHGLHEALVQRDMLRKRYVPNSPCSGTLKGLCKTHFLPLYVTKWSDKDEPLALKCTL